MSTRYPGALITKTPVTPAGPQQDGAASGVWTLDQQMQYQKQGVWPTQGTQGPSAYIENLFSTYLYTGTGAAQTITNGIDLSGKGGLTWIKSRTTAFNHTLVDTVRGATNLLVSNTTAAQATQANSLTAFTSTGFSIGAGSIVNYLADNIVSWTFREQPKFFDIVTYTGTGSNTTIAHNLGSTPGCIIVKRTDTTSDWQVYHSSLANTQYAVLNTTAVPATGATRWNSTTPTSSVFSVGTDATVNASGGTYVAYIYASNAGGFGGGGTDNVITCGNFTADGSGNATVTLGYEPQWILVKRTNSATDWQIYDIMRGWTVNSSGASQITLYPNLTTGDQAAFPYSVNATGFGLSGVNSGDTFIYIAIRRGPMKTPTDATKVFAPVTYSGNGVDNDQTTNFPVDLGFVTTRNSSQGFFAVDRLRGQSKWPLDTWDTGVESTLDGYIGFDNNTKFRIINNGINRLNSSAYTYVLEAFRRAPGFFDEVCYTGTGVGGQTFAHNLGAVPQMMIVKRRDATGRPWMTYVSALGNTDCVELNNVRATQSSVNYWNNTTPTASVFSIGAAYDVNQPAGTYVAYLFATCAGVSKVGSYTGTGATQTVDCGFTGGARFVLIKRTDSTGDWYVWDTARGMVSGTDPYLLLNTPAAEVNANSVYTATTGFQIVSTAAGINASGGSYIFLAIA